MKCLEPKIFDEKVRRCFMLSQFDILIHKIESQFSYST